MLIEDRLANQAEHESENPAYRDGYQETPQVRSPLVTHHLSVADSGTDNFGDQGCIANHYLCSCQPRLSRRSHTHVHYQCSYLNSAHPLIKWYERHQQH